MKTEAFFQLLRYSIGASDIFPQGISPEEWVEMHDIALQQSLLGVVFYGMEKNAALQIDKPLLLRWYAETEQIKQRNQRLDEATVLMFQQMERDGFNACILKGQGNTFLYPNRTIRTPGDIDIWLLADRDSIYKYVRKGFPETEMLYHHLEYPALNDVMTEIHFFPMFLNNPLYNRRFQKWVKRMTADNHLVYVENEFGRYRIPSIDFNIVYQLSHIRHHFFDEGIGLRQMVDYFFLLRAKGGDNGAMTDSLKYLGLWKFAGAVMWMMKECLGLDERCLVAPPNQRLGQMLLDEVLMTGNFGQYDVRYGNLKGKSRLVRIGGLFKKNFKFLIYYPDDVICGILFRAIGQPLWRLWYMRNR